MIFAAGFLASLFLALAVVVCKDLLSGRILETWQVERQLGLPVIGSLRLQ
jgi:capsular polysaccharide biosynthesis protein